MLNVYICDDEINYIEILACKIKNCLMQNLNMDCSIQGFVTADDFYTNMQKLRPDIIFMDVILNNINSIDWLIEHQDEFKNIPIVIMTSFPYEVSKLSDINFCYFIIKSKMSDEQLFRAIKRAIRNVVKKDHNLKTISFGNKTYTINLNSILYIETYRNNIIIHMDNNKQLTIYTTLKKFGEILSPNFLRCHKCYMVNMNYIDSSEPHCLILTNGERINISPKNYKAIINSYRQYMMNL